MLLCSCTEQEKDAAPPQNQSEQQGPDSKKTFSHNPPCPMSVAECEDYCEPWVIEIEGNMNCDSFELCWSSTCDKYFKCWEMVPGWGPDEVETPCTCCEIDGHTQVSCGWINIQRKNFKRSSDPYYKEFPNDDLQGCCPNGWYAEYYPKNGAPHLTIGCL